MEGFKIIETQEQLDEIIKGRINRERETLSKKYEGYVSPEDYQAKIKEFETSISGYSTKLQELQGKIENHNKELAERDSKIKAYESHSVKTRIANELGLSYDAVNFLQGDNEESIRQNAEALKSLLGVVNVAPLANVDINNSKENDVDAALLKTIKQFKGE